MRTAVTEIRVATVDDLDGVVDLAWRFVKFSPYGGLIGSDRDELASVILGIIRGRGVCFVADVGDEIRGALVGQLATPWTSPQVQLAVELGWWVDEDLRGTTAGGRLLKEFEDWAERHQVTGIVMSDLVIDGVATLGNMLDKHGYRLVERAHLKERI